MIGASATIATALRRAAAAHANQRVPCTCKPATHGIRCYGRSPHHGRLVIVVLLVLLADRYDSAVEVRYALWRRWPWRTPLVERVPGIPEFCSILLPKGQALRTPRRARSARRRRGACYRPRCAVCSSDSLTFGMNCLNASTAGRTDFHAGTAPPGRISWLDCPQSLASVLR